MGGDIRDAWRWWRRRPLHPTAVVLLLAVGITANAVVFTFVERLLVSPLAVDRPATLVSLGRMSWPNYRSFAERLDGAAGVTAFANQRLLAGWTLDALHWSGIVPPLPGGADADPYGIALVAGLSAAAPCAAGALSAIRIRRFETSRALQPEAALHGATTRSTPMRALLAVEAALSFALVCGALLVVDDLRSKMRIDPAATLRAE